MQPPEGLENTSFTIKHRDLFYNAQLVGLSKHSKPGNL